MAEHFVIVEQLSVVIGSIQVIDNLNLTIQKGEQWAITGPSGSGKSVLAHTLMGRHFHSGEIHYSGPVKVSIVEQQHRFLNRSGTSDLYYQQRFNASDADQTMTVEQELSQYATPEKNSKHPQPATHAPNAAHTPNATHTPHATHNVGLLTQQWLDELHISPLLHRPLIQLSNGENKRVQLAIALLEAPDLLILDNPFLGLDVEGRATLQSIINRLTAKGMQIILITNVKDLPSSITHIARLEGGKWTFTGPRDQLPPESSAFAHQPLDQGILARLKQLSPSEAHFDIAVKMEDVSVYYGEKALLKHIQWEVRKGERWNVSGPNGAGKSTLLSLITADNPQAYANPIWLFDRQRGTGETIWEIKQKIGFVSPELHLYFDYSATCFDVIASGIFDTIGLFRQLSPEQEQQVLLWMRLLGLEGQRTRRLTQLSSGQQRKVLLARALIKNPPMLILDEPCQGLDEEQTAYFRGLIDELCVSFGTTLIYVSHYRQELPDCVDKFLRLENGMIVP